MKKIELLRISIEGFGSYQKQVNFKLNRGGVNLLKGKNGAGKTTIFSALSWALHKVDLKGSAAEGVMTWEWQRLPTFRGTRVITEFIVDDYRYMIARHIDFKGTTKGLTAGSKLMIFKKPVEAEGDITKEDLVTKELHKDDMNAYIERLIGVGSKAFLNSILFGQRMARLVNAKNDDKRKLFEELCDLEFVATAKAKAEQDRDVLAAKVLKTESDIGFNEALILSKMADFTEKEKILNHFEEEKKKRVDGVKAELKIAEATEKAEKKTVKELQDLAAKYDTKKSVELDEALDKLEVYVATKAEELRRHRITLKDTEENHIKSGKRSEELQSSIGKIATTCPSCTQPLPKDKIELTKENIRKEWIEENKVGIKLQEALKKMRGDDRTLSEALEELNVQVAADTQAYNDFQASMKTYSEAVTKLEGAEKALATVEKSVKDIKARLKTEEDAKAPEVDLAGITAVIDKLRKSIETSKKLILGDKAELDRLKWWITKGFSSSGIKAFVFNAMLHQVNIFAEKYASKLGMGVHFSIDTTKPSKPFVTKCYKGSHEVDYFELSGGQQQRIDICLAFAMHDTISHLSNFNVLIVDEIFEGLDEEGVDAVFEFIRIKAGDDRSVYVVTHSTLLDSLNSKTISVELDAEQSSYVK